jgi:hypothetical protein
MKVVDHPFEIVYLINAPQFEKQVDELFMEVYGGENYTDGERIARELTSEKLQSVESKIILAVNRTSAIILGAVVYFSPSSSLRADAKEMRLNLECSQ